MTGRRLWAEFAALWDVFTLAAVFLSVALVVASCSGEISYKSRPADADSVIRITTPSAGALDLARERVGGCLYVVGRANLGGLAIVHAGDCDNPIHRRTDVAR